MDEGPRAGETDRVSVAGWVGLGECAFGGEPVYAVWGTQGEWGGERVEFERVEELL
jgi:hypothetical protein